MLVAWGWDGHLIWSWSSKRVEPERSCSIATSISDIICQPCHCLHHMSVEIRPSMDRQIISRTKMCPMLGLQSENARLRKGQQILVSAWMPMAPQERQQIC